MASIKIHQDLYNFERTRKGFTDRQIASGGTAVLLCAGMTALLGYAVGIPYPVAAVFGIVCGAPAIIAGFVPLYGMRAEEFAQRAADLAARGNTITWAGERVEPMVGKTSREYQKRMRRKGAECAIPAGNGQARRGSSKARTAASKERPRNRRKPGKNVEEE